MNNEKIFAVERISPDKEKKVLALHNFSNERIEIVLSDYSGINLISGNTIDKGTLILKPHEVVWIDRSF